MPGAERLLRVEAPHFVAGFLVKDGRCFYAAPILGWAVGKSEDELMAYFDRKGWKVQELIAEQEPQEEDRPAWRLSAYLQGRSTSLGGEIDLLKGRR